MPGRLGCSFAPSVLPFLSPCVWRWEADSNGMANLAPELHAPMEGINQGQATVPLGTSGPRPGAAGAMETGSRGEIHLSSPISYSGYKPIGRGQLSSHHNGCTAINHSPLHALGHKCFKLERILINYRLANQCGSTFIYNTGVATSFHSSISLGLLDLV